MGGLEGKVVMARTPGPWRVETWDEYVNIWGPVSASLEDPYQQALGGEFGPLVAHHVKRDDAVLVAAAPEMLEALRKFHKEYERSSDCSVSVPVFLQIEYLLKKLGADDVSVPIDEKLLRKIGDM